MKQSDATIVAIVAEVRSRMPTVEQLTALPDDGLMGPDVTIPAVWMHLLLSSLTLLSEQAVRMDAERAQSLLPRRKIVTEQDMTDLAVAMAEYAAPLCSEQISAAQAMFQGGIALLMQVLPPDGVYDAVAALPEVFELHARLGHRETRQ